VTVLEPSERLTYLEELRPPEGYQLDRAIATTYTMDLMALLVAPFSMALMEQREKDGSRSPLALLAALRKMSKRLAVFCDQGRIAVPGQDQLLYSYLEDAVVEVKAPKGGAFHPKMWVLRFTRDDEPTFYRFLCLSRNLTFDRSWDTALVLEGYVKDTAIQRLARNEPLSSFVAMLPSFAVSPVTETVQSHVDIVAEELRRVDFEVPDIFRDSQRRSDLTFMPMGTSQHEKTPVFKGAQRILVVSPFLTEGWLKDVVDEVPDFTLVSRSDALDGLSDATYAFLVEHGVTLYELDEAAERPEEVAEHEEAVPETPAASAGEDEQTPEHVAEYEEGTALHGLHAKLFVVEFSAQRVDVWTGSANATSSGFQGGNVEFLVGLWGVRKYVGIKQLLGTEETKAAATSFGHLIVPYDRPETRDPGEEIRNEMEKGLEEYRAALISSQLRLVANPVTDSAYDLTLACTCIPVPLKGISATCVPVTLPSSSAVGLNSGGDEALSVFAGLPTSALTRFVAFRLEFRLSGEVAKLGFVLKIEADGFPEDRDSRVLESIIQDTEQFMRYLVLLLSDGDDPAMLDWGNPMGGTPWGADSTEVVKWDELPLFERLVRAFSRQPEELSHIAETVDDMRKIRSDILPEEFERLWDTVYRAHQMRGPA
jgi:hypothetical protein